MHLRYTLHKMLDRFCVWDLLFLISIFFPILLVNVYTFSYFHKYTFKAVKMKSIKCTTKLLDRILIGARIREIRAKEVR